MHEKKHGTSGASVSPFDLFTESFVFTQDLAACLCQYSWNTTVAIMHAAPWPV